MQIPTPVIRAKALSKGLNRDVWLKIEIWHPTGSHKDRESIMIIEECKRRGIYCVGCGSTGNMGISLAYFSKIAGMECHVWLSPQAEQGKVSLLNALSAHTHIIDAQLDEVYTLSSQEMHARKMYNANPGVCPAKIIANAEIGREVVKQVENVDVVVCSVNNGTHLLGVAEGLKGSGVRIIGVYSHSSIASSIRGFYQVEGSEKIHTAITQSGGALIEATDEDLRSGVLALYGEGIIPEVSSAGVVGVFKKIKLAPDERVCCIITGSGLKTPAELELLLNDHKCGR